MSDRSHCDASTSEAETVRLHDVKRRRFLLAFGAGAAGAASASALAAAPAVSVESAADKPAAAGYRETDHVRTYYATTRL
jgi:hypothetical protein